MEDGDRKYEDTLKAMGANAINLSIQIKQGQQIQTIYPYAIINYKNNISLLFVKIIRFFCLYIALGIFVISSIKLSLSVVGTSPRFRKHWFVTYRSFSESSFLGFFI